MVIGGIVGEIFVRAHVRVNVNVRVNARVELRVPGPEGMMTQKSRPRSWRDGLRLSLQRLVDVY